MTYLDNLELLIIERETAKNLLKFKNYLLVDNKGYTYYIAKIKNIHLLNKRGLC